VVDAVIEAEGALPTNETRREQMKKKAIIMALAFSAGVFVSTLPGEAAIAANGQRLNGNKFNGQKLNGSKMNGSKINGRRLNGTKINGAKVNGENLNGASVNGIPSSLAGLDFTTISHQGLGK